MDFNFTDKEEGFRKEVRSWLEQNLTDDLRGKAFAASRGERDVVEKMRAWQRKMYDAGYVGMDWPKEFGGRGASLVEMIILYQEMSRAEAPQFLNRGGLSILGPSLMNTVTMFDWSIAGSFAQPRALTTFALNGPPSWTASPRGTTNSAKSMMTATFLRLDDSADLIAWRLSVRSRYRSINSSAEPGSRMREREDAPLSVPRACSSHEPQSSAPRVARTPRLRS